MTNMKMKTNVFLLLLISSIAYSQNIFSSGDRVFTVTNNSTYTDYDIDGNESKFVTKNRASDKKKYSGSVTVVFEGRPGRLNRPVLFNGEYTAYAERGFGNLDVGDRLYSIQFNVMNNIVDGLHFIDGVDFYDNYSKTKWVYQRDKFAVIAGNIVGYPDKKLTDGKYLSDDYYRWLSIGLNDPWPNGRYFPKLQAYSEEELYYDLEKMVTFFLDDYKNHLADYTLEQAMWQQSDSEYMNFIDEVFWPLTDQLDNITIIADFEKLENGVIARSYGIDDDDNIIIKVDPDHWLNADFANRWYILYHELGHDVLNFRHGQGGRMMFNYPTKEYNWEDFFNDRDEMFLKALNQKYPQGVKDGIQPTWSNY